MKTLIRRSVWCLGVMALCSGAAAHAQESARVYRCGNEYTNQPDGTRICKQVTGGHVTVIIEGTHAVSPLKAGSGNAPPSAVAATEKVGADAQRQRDQGARAVLEAELQRAQTQYASLLREWNQGAPERQPDEAGQTQRYQARIEQLRAAVQRSQADVAGLQRELARLTP